MNYLVNLALSLILTAPLATVKPLSRFTACIDERPWAPYTNPDLEKPGNMQIVVFNASRDLQVHIEVEALPWKRCLENVRLGKTDAVIGASDLPGNRKTAEFPRISGHQFADKSRSLGTARIMLVKRSSSRIDWNGKSLSHLTKPVGTAMGTRSMKAAVEKFGGESDDRARTDDQNIRKLLQNRVDLMAGYEFDLKQLINKSYQGQVTILDTPLAELHYFLAFSKPFYEKNPAFAEALWNKIAAYQNGALVKSVIREELTATSRFSLH